MTTQTANDFEFHMGDCVVWFTNNSPEYVIFIVSIKENRKKLHLCSDERGINYEKSGSGIMFMHIDFVVRTIAGVCGKRRAYSNSVE